MEDKQSSALVPQLTTYLKRDTAVLIDCEVQLPQFEGPLDLLLHLIRNHELDLVNLNVSAITRQYLSYLDYMREMNLDLASEYLLMAATLTYLKSRVILPAETEDEATGPDPRAALIRRLLELKNYKELATALAARPRLYRDVFLAKNTGVEEIESLFEVEVALTNPFQLTESYRQLIERQKTHVHRVVTDEVPILSCVSEIVQHLRASERIQFLHLLPENARPQHVISMFLGVLETARLGFTGINQQRIFGPIEVERKVDPSVLENAESRIQGLSWG